MNPDNKNILTQLVCKRLETTMIGCLARFESAFGYLWGQNKPLNKDLTDQELYFDDLWRDVRNNILNHGNHQIRSLTNDINKALQDKPVTKYHYKFYVKNPEENPE
jgi:hypothetical protein